MTYVPRLDWLKDSVLTPPASANAKDEEWNDRVGMSGTINGLDSSWTTAGAAQTRSYKNGKLILSCTPPGSGIANISCLYKAQPSTPYTVTVEIALSRFSNYNQAQLSFMDSGSPMKLWTLGFYQDGVVNTDEYRRANLALSRYASVTSRTSVDANLFMIAQRRVWLQITNSGTTLTGRWSPTGTPGMFEQYVSESYATAGLTPTRFGLGLEPFTTNTPVAEFGPVRVT